MANHIQRRSTIHLINGSESKVSGRGKVGHHCGDRLKTLDGNFNPQNDRIR